MKMVLRIALGIVFIYASADKILNPSSFAKIIYGYDIFPLLLINIIAITVPFIELVTGLFLIFKIYQKPALLIINFFLSFFIIILSYNLLRGHEFDCGCFTVVGTGHIYTTGQFIIRDLILLSCGLFLFFDKLSFSHDSKT